MGIDHHGDPESILPGTVVNPQASRYVLKDQGTLPDG